MAHTRTPTPGGPQVYQIRIKGHLGHEWSDWFEGLTITALDNGETLFTGAVADQAALYGLLKKVRDLGLPLLSVSPLHPEEAEGRDATLENNHPITAPLEEHRNDHLH